LYNSTEYSSANYNIYDCNENFCRVMHKIIVLKTYENIEKFCDGPYYPARNMGNIFLMVDYHNILEAYKYTISNKEIVNSHAILNKKFVSFGDPRCYDLVENEYCILFIGVNNDGQRTSFYIKKHTQFSCNDKFNTLTDLYDNAIDLFGDLCTFYNIKPNDVNAILHDNYIWLTNHIMISDDMIINYYAINVTTNVKYLITQTKDVYYANKQSLHYFTK